MVTVNIAAVVGLTHALLPLLAGPDRFILFVASTAALPGGPQLRRLCRDQAFVLSFGQALHEELKADGIAVGVLCPGPTATEFDRIAGLAHGGLTMDVDRGGRHRPGPLRQGHRRPRHRQPHPDRTGEPVAARPVAAGRRQGHARRRGVIRRPFNPSNSATTSPGVLPASRRARRVRLLSRLGVALAVGAEQQFVVLPLRHRQVEQRLQKAVQVGGGEQNPRRE